MQDWMTVRELAKYLKISHHTVYHWVHKRSVPHTKAPGSGGLRFNRERIDEWVASGEVKTLDEQLKGDPKQNGKHQTAPGHGRQV